MTEESGRKSLPHDPPPFIDPAGELFFITICCKPRGLNQLCHPEMAANLFASARHYRDSHRWSLSLLVLMPDHLHMLASFNREQGMTNTIRNWKRYVATQYGIQWQRDFFDHRLRSDESFVIKPDTSSRILFAPVWCRMPKIGFIKCPRRDAPP